MDHGCLIPGRQPILFGYSLNNNNTRIINKVIVSAGPKGITRLQICAVRVRKINCIGSPKIKMRVCKTKQFWHYKN